MLAHCRASRRSTQGASGCERPNSPSGAGIMPSSPGWLERRFLISRPLTPSRSSSCGARAPRLVPRQMADPSSGLQLCKWHRQSTKGITAVSAVTKVHNPQSGPTAVIPAPPTQHDARFAARADSRCSTSAASCLSRPTNSVRISCHAARRCIWRAAVQAGRDSSRTVMPSTTSEAKFCPWSFGSMRFHIAPESICLPHAASNPGPAASAGARIS